MLVAPGTSSCARSSCFGDEQCSIPGRGLTRPIHGHWWSVFEPIFPLTRQKCWEPSAGDSHDAGQGWQSKGRIMHSQIDSERGPTLVV